jgi:hypothetical protein
MDCIEAACYGQIGLFKSPTPSGRQPSHYSVFISPPFNYDSGPVDIFFNFVLKTAPSPSKPLQNPSYAT